MNELHPKHHGAKLSAYVAGFSLSVLLTLLAFAIAYLHTTGSVTGISEGVLISAVIALAVIQLFVQAVFFLHLSHRENDRHNLLSFIFTIFIVLFIGIGSLWIMDNLKHNMTPAQIDAYLHKEN